MISVTHKNPSEPLAKYIRKISILESKGKVKFLHKLTPSAFTYFSYNHDDVPQTILGTNKKQPGSKLQLAGPKINTVIHLQYKGILSQILIEFSGSGFYYLFHISPSKLLNEQFDLADFIDPEIYRQLEAELFKTESNDQRIGLLEEFLFEKQQKALPFNKYIEKSLQIMDERIGSVHIAEVAEEVGISERQFDRKFREIVGISPKNYLKILQLHYVINLMQSKKYGTIQELAYQADYYDLAHFINQFKLLTGFTPNEFINSDKHIGLKYFTDIVK